MLIITSLKILDQNDNGRRKKMNLFPIHVFVTGKLQRKKMSSVGCFIENFWQLAVQTQYLLFDIESESKRTAVESLFCFLSSF